MSFQSLVGSSIRVWDKCTKDHKPGQCRQPKEFVNLRPDSRCPGTNSQTKKVVRFSLRWIRGPAKKRGDSEAAIRLLSPRAVGDFSNAYGLALHRARLIPAPGPPITPS